MCTRSNEMRPPHNQHTPHSFYSFIPFSSHLNISSAFEEQLPLKMTMATATAIAKYLGIQELCYLDNRHANFRSLAAQKEFELGTIHIHALTTF